MTEEQDCFEKTSLDEQLSCLQDQLLDSQKVFQDAESVVKERASQIEVLRAFINEFDRIIADYKVALPALIEKQKSYDKICKDEKSCLESILGESCAKKVCEKAAEINDAIASREKDIKARESELENEKEKREKSEKNRNEAKAKFDQWKDPKKSIESRFKLLDQIKKEIDKEHDEHNDTIAYYLLTCKDKFCKLTEGEPIVYPLEQFKEKLNEVWKNYITADSDHNKQDAIVKGLEKQLETKKAQLEADKKSLETRIRRKLIELANSPACSKTNLDTSTETY